MIIAMVTLAKGHVRLCFFVVIVVVVIVVIVVVAVTVRMIPCSVLLLLHPRVPFSCFSK